MRFAALAVVVLAVLGTGTAASARPRDKESFEVHGETTCTDGSGRWMVRWTIDNKTTEEARIVEARVAADGRDADGAELPGFTDGFAPARGSGHIFDELVVSADQDAARISVTLRWEEPEATYDINRLSDYVERPEPCTVRPEVPVPADRPAGLLPLAKSTCTELLIAITTPIDSDITAAELRSSVTRARQVLTLTRGRESIARFPGRDGLAVDVTLVGGAGWARTVTWQPPVTCASASASAQAQAQTGRSSPATRDIRVTVAAVTGAAVLAVAGLALLAFRRRSRRR
ncbi:hypothetical protein AB0J80_28600 [Actinoplanes sp. NPDC049548]|uniref:hypothetical protein n=1 Tax=Actinoplanes sp. NPDC049548 TaxID=3155152 RepID=UPI003433216B